MHTQNTDLSELNLGQIHLSSSSSMSTFRQNTRCKDDACYLSCGLALPVTAPPLDNSLVASKLHIAYIASAPLTFTWLAIIHQVKITTNHKHKNTYKKKLYNKKYLKLRKMKILIFMFIKD